jgi:hypothetical protein
VVHRQNSCAAAVAGDRLLAMCPKTALPDNGESARRARSARPDCALETEINQCGQRVPFDTDVVPGGRMPRLKLRVDTCEDLGAVSNFEPRGAPR